MTSYTIKALVPEWTVTPDPLSSTNIRTGKITSTNSAKSKMGVYYGERELARSDDEIAFGKVDLIVPPGPGNNGGTPLPEDRQPAGGTAPATNELTPGTFILLLPQDQTNRVATTLTLKADPNGGSVTLDQHGLTDLKIYTDEALHEELTLPKTWTNGDTPPSTLYMVGSSSSTNLQSAQGTLDLTYKTTLAADGVEYSIKDTVGVTLLPVELITPAGDPVNSPVDGGDGSGTVPDGANEFTFSTAASGVLTLKFNAKVPGNGGMGQAIQDRFKFEVDAIGNSTLAWDAANPGGKVTANGDFITATVTFTGLPQSNSDFGKKKARVMFDGAKTAEKEFEVFYDAKSKNHPEGDPAHPNWFHYYKQNAGGGSYSYDPIPGARSSSLSAGGDSSIKIGDYVHSPGGTFITTTKASGLLKATGWSSTNKYYAHFVGVLAHERQHANGEVTQGGATDPDSDWLATSLETGTSSTDPNDPVSASSGVAAVAGFTDDEVYAGGPVEENGIKNADTSKDWASLGTNHKP